MSLLDEKSGFKLILRGGARWPDENHPQVVYSLCREGRAVKYCANLELDLEKGITQSVYAEAFGAEIYAPQVWNDWGAWWESWEFEEWRDLVLSVRTIEDFAEAWLISAAGYYLCVAQEGDHVDVVEGDAPNPWRRGQCCIECVEDGPIYICRGVEQCGSGVYRAAYAGSADGLPSFYKPVAAVFRKTYVRWKDALEIGAKYSCWRVYQWARPAPGINI